MADEPLTKIDAVRFLKWACAVVTVIWLVGRALSEKWTITDGVIGLVLFPPAWGFVIFDLWLDRLEDKSA